MKTYLIFLILAPHFSTQQYGNHYENDLHTGHHHYADDYKEDYYRRSSRHKKHSRRPREYDENSCVCDCRVCDPKPCCRPVCTCEEPEPDQNYEPGPQTPEQNYGGGTNVVFVPYPFPLVVPGQPIPIMPTAAVPTPEITDSTTPITSTKTTTRITSKTRTTPKTTTKSQKTTNNPMKKETESEEDGKKKPSLRQLLDLLQNNANIRIGISRREPSVRHFKTTTQLPKYGIVPLSDHLLEGLISQVRSVKDLQSYA